MSDRRTQLKSSKSSINVASSRKGSKKKSQTNNNSNKNKSKNKSGPTFDKIKTRTRHTSIQAEAEANSKSPKTAKLKSRSKSPHSSSKKKDDLPSKKLRMRRMKSANVLSVNVDEDDMKTNNKNSRKNSSKNKNSNKNNSKNSGGMSEKRRSQRIKLNKANSNYSPSSPTSPRGDTNTISLDKNKRKKKPRRSVEINASPRVKEKKNKNLSNKSHLKRKSAMTRAEASKNSSHSDMDNTANGDTSHLQIRPVGTEDVNTKIYARVRRLMPWEPNKVSIKIMGNKVQNKTNRTMNEYAFSKVFTPQDDNEKVFKTVVLPMISNVLSGFNAVLIAYGQTGSGKTFSMLGKPKQNVVGLLPMMLEYMVKYKSVTKVELSAVEAFAYHVAKIELFDLFAELNQTQVWNDKQGNTSLNMLEATTVQITDAQDAHDKIIYAHRASHFAPTGKNPESSRGHVTFVAKVTQQQSMHTKLVSYFVFVDCAGSEGESAFTPDFIQAVSKESLMARRLEAGCINTGLSQLQIIFNELRVKGELNATLGNGLRRILHPYINTQTFLSVLFALSPSVNNRKATESTLKFAVTAGMVKVKPIQKKSQLDFDTIVKELRDVIARQEKEMEQNNDLIDEITNKIERAKIVTEQMKIKNQRENQMAQNAADLAAMGLVMSDETVEQLNDEKINEIVKQRSKQRHHKRISSNVPDEVALKLLAIDEEEKRVENEFGSGVDNIKRASRTPLTPLTENNDNIDLKNGVNSDTLSGGISGMNANADASPSGQSAFDELQALLAKRNGSKQVDLDKFKKFEKVRTKSWQMLAKDTINFVELDENVNNEAEEDYRSLKERHAKMGEMTEEELRMYAAEVVSLYMQEQITYKGLAMSTGAIIDFLHGKYEGMLKFFQVRKILPKEVPQFDNNLLM